MNVKYTEEEIEDIIDGKLPTPSFSDSILIERPSAPHGWKKDNLLATHEEIPDLFFQLATYLQKM